VQAGTATRIVVSRSIATPTSLQRLRRAMCRIECKESTALHRRALGRQLKRVLGNCAALEYLSRGRSPASGGSGTIGPALSAAPTGASLSGHEVVGCHFVAVAAAAWQQDDPPDAFQAEEREY
jgi:hypothetical protein